MCIILNFHKFFHNLSSSDNSINLNLKDIVKTQKYSNLNSTKVY